MAASRAAASDVYEAGFRKAQTGIEAIFAGYDPEDIILTLAISDLWLPNVASQVKHHLAFAIFASVAPDRFAEKARINDYATFRKVLDEVYSLLPHFAMLEDYVPESDWGEVKLSWQGNLVRLFYGSALERVPDFVESFRIVNAGNSLALRDMGIALSLQNRILSSIDRSIVGDASGIRAGHIELPSELFWHACRDTLRAIAGDVATRAELSSELILEQGTLAPIGTASAFGDAIMKGTALPALLIRVGENLYPLVPRNAIVTVMDYWGRRPHSATGAWHHSLTVELGAFLARRVDHNEVKAGPLIVHSASKKIPVQFAAVIMGDRSFYFVVGLDRRSLGALTRIEADLMALADSGVEWGIHQECEEHSIQFRHADGHLPRPEQITVLAVIPHETSEMGHLALPHTKSARVLTMPDFVSIFDSISDLAELDHFWLYLKTNRPVIQVGFLGLADIFAAFRYSEGVLVEGAVQPDMITLDPHGGSNWRFKELAEFWRDSPTLFPDDDPSGWTVEPVEDRIQSVVSKAEPVQSWSTTIGGCTLHCVYRLGPEMEIITKRLIGLFTHCTTDALAQRREMLENEALFRRRRLTVEFYPAPAAPADDEVAVDQVRPLMDAWELIDAADPARVTVRAAADLERALDDFTDPTDSSFEVACAIAFVDGLSAFLGGSPISDLVARLNPTVAGKPRFTLVRTQRAVDVPDVIFPRLPRPDQYKLARRAIAVILKDNGAEPGRYELDAAKALIDPARDAFRDRIHTRLAQLSKPMVLLYCIDQHDALSAEYQRTLIRLRHSLSHAVTYDRTEAMANAHERYVLESRNYRYLLECCLSESATNDLSASEDDILQLIADANWLYVLSGASDTLHNDVAVAGLEINDMYVPEVFYSIEERGQRDVFAREQASFGLGLNMDTSVETLSAAYDEAIRLRIDVAFLADTGFAFSHLLGALSVLSQWQSFQGKEDLYLSYRASADEITELLTSVIDGLNRDEAERITAFLILQPNQIRRLLGKSVDEGDVPVWDHNKRGSRYAIRPLVPLGVDLLAWGAATAERSRSIWTGNITGGYLPADFPWPTVQREVRAIKAGHEKQLERQALEICARHTPFAIPGVDFKRRFPGEGFDDVGDFDVLAYWPEQNRWLVIECKYNQPPFCLKDARRLRERIFGIGSDRAQFAKIERRRVFLTNHLERVRVLLGWTEATSTTPAVIAELYVSHDIYWWMRHPPYEVPSQFVRIDGLNGWLLEKGYGTEPKDIDR
jgi:hypothetical protein